MTRTAIRLAPVEITPASAQGTTQEMARFLGDAPQCRAEPPRDIRDRSAGVDPAQQPAFPIVDQQRLRTLMIDRQAMPDLVRMIVRTPHEGTRVITRGRIGPEVVRLTSGVTDATILHPLYQLLVRNPQRDHPIDWGAIGREHRIERSGLRLIARKAVQDPGARLSQVRRNKIDDELIRHQFTEIVVAFERLPE